MFHRQPIKQKRYAKLTFHLLVAVLVFLLGLRNVLLGPLDGLLDDVAGDALVLPSGLLAEPGHLQLEGLVLSLVVEGMDDPGQLLDSLPDGDVLGGILPVVEGELLHLGLGWLPSLPGGAGEVPVGHAGGLDHVQSVFLGLVVVGRHQGRRAEGAEGAVQGEVVHVGRQPVGQDGRGDLGAVSLLVSDGLVTGPIHDLPGVGDEAGDGHPVGLIDAVNSAVAGGEEHLVQDGLLDRQDDPVPALEAEGRAAVLDGLGGVLHLENAPIRRKRRGGKVVSAACRHDWLLRAGGGSCACSTGAGAGDTSARTTRSTLRCSPKT
mmetsp:Transcript_4499/g.10798  ORF Transcript_4499/g.10798 Transcript_4499/m.10798 type:complete len:320 (+) Transcript_4499:216-1175(+)